MSINVTVHGNPISIKRGKMVTCDADSDFERRRRIRLQQVRQQSKEIAADVRNRVRKEKEKQFSKAEKEGEEHLKRWKSRKLLALQQQYRDCLEQIGSAHTRAALERDPQEELNEIAEKNQNEAETRGKLASEKRKNEEAQQKLEAAQPLERKKQTRKIENTRSAMVSKLGRVRTTPIKKKKRKKVSTDVTISNNIVSVSDLSENSISDIENISSNIEDGRSNTRKHSQGKSSGRKKVIPKKHKKPPQKKFLSEDDSLSPEHISKLPSPENYTDDNYSPPSFLSDTCAPSSVKVSGNYKNTNVQLSPSKVRDIIDQHRPMPTYTTNTRISDRIRQRQLTVEDSELRNNNVNYISNDFQREHVTRSTFAGSNKFNIDSYKVSDRSHEQPKESNLPFVPPTSVRNTDESEGQTSRVRFYDHFNRFGKDYDAQPVVQKINKDNIVVQPPSEVRESNEFLEIMQRRDKEAQCRGAKAMEKSKIQKDYKQLMEELPVLQRQERLAQMRTHNPAFHMSDDRYQEMERKRQNRIENLFEKYYHKCKNLETPLITIKPLQKSPPAEEMKLPFTALDMTDSPVQLNVAEWNNVPATTSRENGAHTTRELVSDSRTNELADLLDRVNRQRQLLIQEVNNLPPSSNLENILQDEEIIKIACPCPKNSAASKSSEKGRVFVSTATSPLAVISPSAVLKEKAGKSSNVQSSCTSSKREVESSNSSEASANVSKRKHKKVKVKKHKHVLKDEETQTSPASYRKTSSSKEDQKSSPLASSTNTKGTREESRKTKSPAVEQDEKLCQIIIKLAEESSVEISTSSVSKQISLKRKDQVTQQQPTAVKSVKEKPVSTKVKDSDRKHRATPVSYQRQPSNDVSSSTAYMSPPDMQAGQISAGSSKMDKHTLYKDMLKNKPQQTNIDRPDGSGRKTNRATSSASNKSKDKNVNPHLFKYIQKLLSMSRQSIDDLTVSSISDVSTPGPNVIDSADNTPIIQLHNVMSHFNLSFSDIQRYLSAESSNSSRNNVEVNEPILTEAVIHSSDHDEVKQRVEETVKPAEEMEQIPMDTDDINFLPYSSILSKFTELAQSSCDKISNLTSMIDKIRLEKERILSPLSSDKNDNSYTSYMELPPKFVSAPAATEASRSKADQGEESSGSSSTSQEALNRYLLEVGETNEILNAYVENNSVLNSNTVAHEFVPMLDGIPKYEENENVPMLNFLNPNMNNFVFNTSKPKPPPTLLRNAAKYNINIDMTPHELSTIVEMDTVTSSRNVSDIIIQRPPTPDEHVPSKDVSDDSSTQSEYITISPERYVSPQGKQPEVQIKDKGQSKKMSPKSALKKSKSPSQDRPVSKAEISGVQPLSSDKSSSPEDQAAVLRNMGLGWAVSTLKKTQESLALSSSSDSSKKHVSFKDSNSNSNSDVSLKEVLSRQFLKKLSSSSILTDSSDNSPYIQELQDISEITGAAGSQSRDRSQQRTSTPVQHSKSIDSKNKSKDHLFTGDSDLSSVRGLSDENLFLSIPNLTLDTNKSLNKAKK